MSVADKAETGAGQTEMPKYRSHKFVWALEISAIGELNHGYRSVAFAEKGYQGKSLPEAMFGRYVPVPGDFYVVYADGYESFSPRKAFLEGYTKIGPSFREIKQEIKNGPSV